MRLFDMDASLKAMHGPDVYVAANSIIANQATNTARRCPATDAQKPVNSSAPTSSTSNGAFKKARARSRSDSGIQSVVGLWDPKGHPRTWNQPRESHSDKGWKPASWRQARTTEAPPCVGHTSVSGTYWERPKPVSSLSNVVALNQRVVPQSV